MDSNPKPASLLDAAFEGNIEQVRQLLDSGADVNDQDRWKQTPLILAARCGHVEVVRLLIGSGAKVNARERARPLDEGRRTALFYACERSGQQGLHIAEMLLAVGADPDIPSSCFTPLNLACDKGNLDMVRLLLKHGVNPNGHGKFLSPLANAAQNSHFKNQLEIVRELVSHGADINRDAPICEAASVRRSTKDNWKRPNELDTPVHCLQMFGELLRLGADIHARNADGDTALHCAVRAGSFELVKLCLSHGADVNALGRWDLSPLALVNDRPRLDVARFLIEAGANVNYLAAKASLLDCFVNNTSSRDREERVEVIEFLRTCGAKTFAEINPRKAGRR